MKKKNLNFLLIALAALALVFAGSCSDGSDDDGSSADNSPSTQNSSNETGPVAYESYLSGTTWEVTTNSANGTTNGATSITSIELAFNSTTNAVAGAVEAAISNGSSDVTYTGEFSGTYSVSDDTVTVYFGSGTSVYITLKLDSGSYKSGSVSLIASSSKLTVSDISTSAVYKVSVSPTEGDAVEIDLFDSSLAAGYITDTSSSETEFTCTAVPVTE